MSMLARKILPTYGGSPPFSGANVFLSQHSHYAYICINLAAPKMKWLEVFSKIDEDAEFGAGV